MYGGAMLTRLPSRDEVRAERCRRSLSKFIREAWPILEPSTPFVHAWHIDVICEHLEAVTAGELRRLIINVPPRTAKSTVTCKMWPAWEWLTDPSVRWMCASYSSYLSLRDSQQCRRLIQSAGGNREGHLFERVGYQGVLAMIDPDPWQLMGDQNAKEKFETTATGSRFATSVGARATGEGGERMVIDDPLDPEQARSRVERERANRWWDETMSMRFNQATSAAVIVMQRLHELDLTGHLLEQGGWHHLCLPARYEPKHPFVTPGHVTLEQLTHNVQGEDGSVETIVTPGGRVLPGDKRTIEGELLEPVRLSEDVLAQRLRTLASYGFAGQFQQRPAPAEGGMFKRHWWQRYDASLSRDDPMGRPDDWMFERVIASWDMRFSKSQSEESSFVVGQVWGRHRARFYLLGQVRKRLGFTDTVKAVLAVQERWPLISAVLVEEKANGAAVMDQLARKVTGLLPINPEGGKDVRASAVEPNAEAGDIWLPGSEFIPCPPSIPAANGEPAVELKPTATVDWIEEAAVFPNGAHDDQVDAMSQAITWLLKHGASGGAVAKPRGDKPKDGRRSTEDLRNMKF